MTEMIITIKYVEAQICDIIKGNALDGINFDFFFNVQPKRGVQLLCFTLFRILKKMFSYLQPDVQFGWDLNQNVAI